MKSLALLCLLLLPGAAYAKSDAPALALLDKTAAKVHSLHSLSADYAGTEEYPAHPQSVPDRGTLLLARPNLSCVTYRAADPSRRPNGPAYLPYARQWASDGHTYWTVGYIREYAKHPASPSGKELTVLDPVPDFFDPGASYAAQVRRLQARNMLLRACIKSLIPAGLPPAGCSPLPNPVSRGGRRLRLQTGISMPGFTKQ